MRTAGLNTIVCAVLAVLAAGLPLGAQTRDLSQVRILAIAPFADDNPLNRALAADGAARLSQILDGGRFRIIPTARVAAELQRLGMTPTDLISPSKTVALGTALGADAVLTGRMIEVFYETNRARGNGVIAGFQEGRVTVDVRILDVRTRLKLLEEEIGCSLPALLPIVMDCAVRQMAARVQTR